MVKRKKKKKVGRPRGGKSPAVIRAYWRKASKRSYDKKKRKKRRKKK